jgi:hypothetical protein
MILEKVLVPREPVSGLRCDPCESWWANGVMAFGILLEPGGPCPDCRGPLRQIDPPAEATS